MKHFRVIYHCQKEWKMQNSKIGVFTWIKISWDRIKNVKSFKKCGISKNIAGIEDEAILKTVIRNRRRLANEWEF